MFKCILIFQRYNCLQLLAAGSAQNFYRVSRISGEMQRNCAGNASNSSIKFE